MVSSTLLGFRGRVPQLLGASLGVSPKIHHYLPIKISEQHDCYCQNMQKIFIIVLVISMVVSVSLNFELYSKTRLYYSRLCATQLDPDGRRWSIILPSPYILASSTSLVIIGDSRAEAWPITIRGNLVNAGISGQTTTQILSRYREHALAYSPKTILIQAGINDLKVIPLLPGKKREIINSCKDQLAKMASLAESSGSLVILTTIIPTGTVPLNRRSVWSIEIDEAVREVNSFLLTLRTKSIEVVDLTNSLTDNKGLVKKIYQKDFLHLNPAGYAALNQTMRPVLEDKGISIISD